MSDYVSQNNLQQYTTEVTAKYKTIFATKNEVGSPLVATIASDMVDATKIYVYVGSEAGYTNGHWYYYDGSAWADGGVYNSTAFETDTTLSISGMAADAKAVGDNISNLKSAFIAVQLDELPITIIENEYITHDGEIDQYQGWSRTDYIPVKKYKSITARCNPATSYNMFYDINHTKVGTYFSVYSEDTVIDVPENAVFVIFSNTSAGMQSFTATVELTYESELDSFKNEAFKATEVIAVGDLDDYKTNGAYLINNINAVSSLPEGELEIGTLLVFAYNTSGNYGYVQFYITNSTQRYWYRVNAGGWSEWHKLVTSDELTTILSTVYLEKTIATNSFDSYIANGAYLVNATISNEPYNDARGLLSVFTWNHTNAYGTMQMFVPHNDAISPYYRFYWGGEWSEWHTFAPQIRVHTTPVAGGINVLNPLNFTLSGYIDSADGTTFVSNSNYMCTNDYIDVPFGAQGIWAKFPQTENNDRICCMLFYDAENRYTGSYSGRFDGFDYKAYALIGSGYDIAKFKFWANKTTVNGGSNTVCISFTEPSSFVEYVPEYSISNESLETPNIYLPFKGRTIVNFGDSIFGNKFAPYSVSYALEQITGAIVYNCGFGGTDMAARTSADWDAFSMYRLAYAIANNDFSLQNAVDIDNVQGMPSYFKDTLDLLETIDFDEIDIITIAYGTNDFTGNVLIDNDNDNNPVDTETFKGALRYSLQQIMTAYPHIKIFVCGQTYRFWLDGNNNFLYDSDTHENGNNDKLTDFVEATKSVSEAYHVPFIDNYYSLGINYYNRSYYFPANDGTHHNYLGAKLIADHIKHELF